MSRLVVHKLSSLRRVAPAMSHSFHLRSTVLLLQSTSHSLSTSASPRLTPVLRSSSVHTHSLNITARAVQPFGVLTGSTRRSIDRASTPQRGYSSSSSSSSSSSRIPRSLVFLAPAAVLAFLLSELDLSPTADCAALSGSTSSSSLSLGSSPRLTAPLAGDDWVVASWWRRILAFLIDNSLVSLAFSLADKYLAPVTGPYGSIAVPLLSFLFNFSYETACYIYSDGQTLGKWLLGIRVVRDDGQAMDVTTGALVFGGKVLNILLMADVLYGLLNLDRDGKCIHNVISNTTVVMKVPAETFIQTVQV